MRQINRREFAKLAGRAALVAPLAVTARGEPGMVWPQEAPKKPEAPAPAQPAQQSEAPKPEPPTRSGQAPLKLSKEQEEAVKKAVERRDRQLTAMRSRALPYDAEPAFVFQVRWRPRAARL